MGVVNLSFTKVSGVREAKVIQNVSVNSNLEIEDVKENNVYFGDKESKIIEVYFNFVTKYSPSVGEITIKGFVSLAENSATRKKILDEWKDNKKLPDDLAIPILNFIMDKCHIEDVLISKEINLPLPFKFPKIVKNTDQDSGVNTMSHEKKVNEAK